MPTRSPPYKSRRSHSGRSYRVALAFAQNHPQLAAVRRGVFRYAHEKGNFRFVFSLDTGVSVLAELQDWPGDGVIAHLTTRDQVALARPVEVPLVNYGGALEQSPFPSVHSDYHAEGTLAAKHLIARGFSNFAYLGGSYLWYSRMRLKGYEEALAVSGYRCTTHLQVPSSGLRDEESQFESLQRWLARLPLPVGLMVDRDLRTVQVYEAAWELGLAIPSDVAVISVDNDPLATHAYAPALTSITVRHEEVGYRAMAVLHSLMERQAEVQREEIISVGEIIERGSTDTVVVSDPRLRQIIQHLSNNPDGTAGLKSILDEVGVSRRWAERAFQFHLNQTPADFLRQRRIFRAKQLLREHPQAGIDEIARLAGFYSRRHMNDVFLRVEKKKPSEYRASTREF